MKTKVYRNGVGPSEAEIQTDFFNWLDVMSPYHPELALCFSVPNGSYKSPAARGLFRRTGLRPGVPDTCLPCRGVIDGKAYIGLFIEFKSKKGVLSGQQAVWCNALRNAGHFVRVCREWTEAANIVIEYLELPLTRL